MQAPGNQRRRAFTPGYKADAVALCQTGDKSIGEVARDLDLAESVLRRWVKQTEVDAGQREGLTTAEREELTRLRKENRALRQERDILKRATVFSHGRRSEPVPVRCRGEAGSTSRYPGLCAA